MEGDLSAQRCMLTNEPKSRHVGPPERRHKNASVLTGDRGDVSWEHSVGFRREFRPLSSPVARANRLEVMADGLEGTENGLEPTPGGRGCQVE